MSFVKPSHLYLIGLVPLTALFLAWSSWRRDRALARFGALPTVERLGIGLSARRPRLRSVLYALAALFLVLALSRPRWGSQVSVKAQRGVEVMVVLDVSASMLAEDVTPNRLERAKLVVEDLMHRLAGNDVGLVVFSGSAFLQFPLTNDLGTARTFLASASPSAISRPGTALGKALQVALDSFAERRSTSRVILLLTDGEGHEDDPLPMARQAAQSEVIIHAIGFGSPEGEPIPLRDGSGGLLGYKEDLQGRTVLSRLDELTLQRIVAESGGTYVRAGASGDEVDAILHEIEALETGDAEGQFQVRGIERYEWFAGLALLAVAFESLLGARRGKRRAPGAQNV